MKPKKYVIGLGLVCLFFIIACTSNTNNTSTTTNTAAATVLYTGRWRAILSLSDELELPFNMDITRLGTSYQVSIFNGTEQIDCKDINIQKDSISIKLPVFNSEIKAKFIGRRLHGAWHNYAKGPDYQLPFYAVAGDSMRFQLPNVNDDMVEVDGKWEVLFITDDKKGKTDAIGEFKQDGDKVTGTFLTPTGDYRFLEGGVAGNELLLSCFDGSHAFLFKATMNQFGDMKGDFWSGNHWHETWLAYKNDTITLPNPTQLTSLKKGEETISFSFPNIEGQQTTLADEKYQNKVVMVQVLGTWCPNCMDETKLYTDLYNKYHQKGLEIIGLAYENATTLAEAQPILTQYKQYFGIKYDILYAGEASKKVASASLPMLTEITSFPTTIFIDRQGKVRKIHTGFSGPATSQYETFVTKTESFIEKLLMEDNS